MKDRKERRLNGKSINPNDCGQSTLKLVINMNKLVKEWEIDAKAPNTI